jgi:predicted nucleic acid-binding protein
MLLIVGASVAIKWVAQEAHSDQADSLRRFKLGSLDQMRVAYANILWRLTQRGSLTVGDARTKFDLLIENPLTIQPAATLVRRALEIDWTLSHPIYNCPYLAAAAREGARIVTADSRPLNKLAATPSLAHLALSLETAAAN